MLFLFMEESHVHIARRLLALLFLVAAGQSRAGQVFPYEAVGQGGPNNQIDSNPASCDTSRFRRRRLGPASGWPGLLQPDRRTVFG